jgi:hypothetical protein
MQHTYYISDIRNVDNTIIRYIKSLKMRICNKMRIFKVFWSVVLSGYFISSVHVLAASAMLTSRC